jgi:Protein of unknown function (DUF1573)
VLLASLLVLGLAAAPPRAEFLETSYDFGTLLQGRTVAHRFLVRNIGAQPLKIERVEFSQPGMRSSAKAVVAPGAIGEILLEWNTTGLKGAVEADAAVQTSDPLTPNTILRLTGHVRSPVDLLPFGAIFLSTFMGEDAQAVLRVVNNETTTLLVTRIEPGADFFQASIHPVTLGKVYEVRVRAASGLAPGRYDGSLTLETNSAEARVLTIPVHLSVKANVYPSPDRVDFGEVSLDRVANEPGLLALLNQTVLVKKRAGHFRILSVTSDVETLSIDRSPGGPTGTFRLDIGLAPARLRPGPLSGTIRIRTDERHHSEIVLPVTGTVR